MNANENLITRFYTAFQARDAAGMAACYHPEIRFSDAAFPDLHGNEAGAMWAMLCARGKDLRLEFSKVEANDSTGSAHWDAYYTFAKTGRKVINRIDASFKFKDGLILEHKDHFNFARWARQALGPIGLMLGNTRWLQNKVQGEAAKGLREFLASSG